MSDSAFLLLGVRPHTINRLKDALYLMHSAFVIFFSERQAAYRMRMKIFRFAIKHACILRRRLFVRCVVRTIGREEGFVTHGMEIYQNNENQRRS